MTACLFCFKPDADSGFGSTRLMFCSLSCAVLYSGLRIKWERWLRIRAFFRRLKYRRTVA